jgi:glycosyltransferase involved in cell wall biosynthesis
MLAFCALNFIHWRLVYLGASSRRVPLMPKILYLITEDWFFVSHFLPMARTARAAGFDVVVATRVNKHGLRIAAEGFEIVPIDVDRWGFGAFESLRYIARAFKLVRDRKPDIVHCIALKPVVLGGIGAKLAGAKGLVLAPTGLGQLWTGHGLADRLVRGAVRVVVGTFLRGPRTRYLFENDDDPGEFRFGRNDSQVTIVGGAGVDPLDFPMLPQPPAPPVKIAVVARIIAPKGIAEAVEATRRARALGAAVELNLFGDADASDPRSVAQATLRQWSSEPGIQWHGSTTDVARVWREHHIALFLSYYREGVPRTLIEAAASGRPIVTTDMPGCRDVVRHRKEGFLVPAGDVEAAARALVELAGNTALRARLGAAANARFRERFTEQAVTRTVGELYRSLAPYATPGIK